MRSHRPHPTAKRTATTIGLALMALACGGPEQEEPDTPITIADAGFATPESVLHDVASDVYLVSNINGDPFAADDNGFISRVSPAGELVALKWIDGQADGVTLNAPKGMAIAGDILFVADVNVVRMFDRASGDVMGETAIEGATFLNDVTPREDGSVYVTDSGFQSGFEPSGTDAFYHITADGNVHQIITNADLGNPNGVTIVDGEAWVVTFGSGQLYRVAGGATHDAQTLPTGGLDGLVEHDGFMYVSSWDGQSILKGTPDGTFEVVASDLEAPADIGFDAKRERLLVPLFQANEVRIIPAR